MGEWKNERKYVKDEAKSRNNINKSSSNQVLRARF